MGDLHDHLSNMCSLILSYVPHLDDSELAVLYAAVTYEVTIRSMGGDQTAAQEPKPAHE